MAIARELRALVPELEIDWLAQDPVTRVLAAAFETFGGDAADRISAASREAARRAALWLRRPHRALDGEVPLALCTTDAGARLVEDALGRIAYGVFA